MKTKMQIKLLLFTFFINWIKKYFNPWSFFSSFFRKGFKLFPVVFVLNQNKDGRLRATAMENSYRNLGNWYLLT